MRRGPEPGWGYRPRASSRESWQSGWGHRSGGRGAPKARSHLVELVLRGNPKLRVDGALQRLDDPVEVHLPGWGLRGPRTSRPDCRFSFIWTLSAFSSATPGLPHSPTPATVATCSHLLRHSDSAPPVLPLSPPQLALHSPFYDSRWEAGEVRRGSGASFTAASSRGRDAVTGSRGRRHDAVRTELPTSTLRGNNGAAEFCKAAAELLYGKQPRGNKLACVSLQLLPNEACLVQ